MRNWILINPAAGSIRDIGSVLPHFSLLDRPVVRVALNVEDMKAITQEALDEKALSLVCVGGDGTLNVVLTALGPDFSRLPLGVVPMGTGNDFSRTMDDDARLSEFIQGVVEKKFYNVDVVECLLGDGTTRFMLNASCGGFSGEVSRNTGAKSKQFFGGLSYIGSAISSVTDMKVYQPHFVIDDVEEIEVDLVNIAICNGRSVAGGNIVAPAAEPDDGFMDVILFKNASFLELLKVAGKSRGGSHLNDENVIFRKARHIKLSCRENIPFNIDGEVVESMPVEFKVLPSVLRFAWPKQTEEIAVPQG